MARYIDAHCHLTDKTVPHGGPVKYFICNTDRESGWTQILGLVTTHPNITPCIGIHPWYVDTVTPGWDVRMQKILRDNPNVMVGEIGLDHVRENYDLQQGLFIRQIEIAVEFNRPAHIHCVRAWGDMTRTLRQIQPGVPLIMHGFNASPNVMCELFGISDVYFSFGKMALRRTPRIIAALATAPMNRILVESDCVPDESDVILPQIISVISEIKNVDKDKMADIVYKNTLGIIENDTIKQNEDADWGRGHK